MKKSRHRQDGESHEPNHGFRCRLNFCYAQVKLRKRRPELKVGSYKG